MDASSSSSSSGDSLASQKEHGHSTTPQPSAGSDGRHKLRLSISLGVLVMTTGILPQLLYFVLKYRAHTAETITLAIPSALFGASSLVAYAQRCWSLGRRESATRPVGGSRWGFDFFHWNYTLGFAYITAVIAAATSIKPALVRVAALPLSLLMLQVCAQLVLVQLLAAAGAAYFCRVSSMPRGRRPIRPALYTIVEDLVAVDGQQGTPWRQAYSDRYESNPALRALLARLSWAWGVSGLCMAAVNIALVFAVRNVDVAWAVGWALPWVWVAVMTVPTYIWVKNSV